MTSIPDHYAALGIDPTADPEVITAAYRALAKKFHPDTGAAAGTASPTRFDEIQKAYEVLRTPESRHAYDLELLAATERELQAHLAAKRRVAVREEQPGTSAPPPDLGDIRPEPATRASVPPPPPQGGGAARSRLPFVVPLLLMMAIGGGAAWLLLPAPPAAPPLPGTAQQGGKSDQPKVASAKPVAPPAQETAPAAAAKPAATPAELPAATPPADTAASDGQPIFGSSVTDDANATVEEASAAPEPVPTPDAGADTPNAASAGGKADKPVFGSSGAMQAPAAAPAEAAPQPKPLPKPKPSQPTRQAQLQKQTTQPRPATQPKQAYVPPRARLQFQDPPQYTPQPDGYSQADDGYPPPEDAPPGYAPPGYAPPGYVPPGYALPGYAPPGYAPPGYEDPGFPSPAAPGMGPYRLVIFERQPGQQATAWSAGVVFNSMGKCTKVGVKTVLRRTAAMDPYADGVRVWYECQQLSQR